MTRLRLARPACAGYHATIMQRHWWVNHKQTFRQEIEGQYLWSPKRRKDGARNQFYENMRCANPGDLVLSYANQRIRHVGRVADFAMTAPKPEEFGTAGNQWGDVGWLLPVYWIALARPVRPKDLIAALGPLLPNKYAPIDPATGNGRQLAYLAEIPRPAFELVMAATDHDALQLAAGGTNSLSFEYVVETIEEAIESRIAADDSLDATVRETLIRARRGQGVFRTSVERHEHACRLTGISNAALLRASHIKPWRLCATAAERLDGMNGLLLTPDADHLFDRGFVSFQDSGEVLVSSRVPRDDLRRLGFDQLVMERFGLREAPSIWRTGTFTPRQCAYLDFHRREIFLS